MLDLSNITLVSVSTSNIYKAYHSLVYSTSGVKFNSVKLLSIEKPINFRKDFEFHKINKFNNIDEWSKFIIYDLNEYINTDYIILVHPDGFVVNPDSWKNEFLDFDYIGAPWPLPKDKFSYRDMDGKLVRVGNSVSLRSKKILELPSKLNLPWEPFHGYYNEDGFLCVKNKIELESNGIKFADIDIAKYFSHEVMMPEIENILPFVFHKWAGSNNIYPKF